MRVVVGREVGSGLKEFQLSDSGLTNARGTGRAIRYGEIVRQIASLVCGFDPYITMTGGAVEMAASAAHNVNHVRVRLRGRATYSDQASGVAASPEIWTAPEFPGEPVSDVAATTYDATQNRGQRRGLLELVQSGQHLASSVMRRALRRRNLLTWTQIQAVSAPKPSGLPCEVLVGFLSLGPTARHRPGLPAQLQLGDLRAGARPYLCWVQPDRRASSGSFGRVRLMFPAGSIPPMPGPIPVWDNGVVGQVWGLRPV